jgi:hypothetical protein
MPVIPRYVPRPPEYFTEPILGIGFLAPFAPAAFAVFFMRRLRALIWIVPASALAILLFLTMTGLTTQRYEVDFLPLLVLAALAVFAELNNTVLNVALAICVAFGTVVNGAMGILGPYSDIVNRKPDRYVKVARFFSPVASLRPQLNPAFDVHFPALIVKRHDFERRDLFHAGQSPYRYEVFLDQHHGIAELVSGYHFVIVSREMPFSDTPVQLEAKYQPETGEAIVLTNGTELLRQKIGTLIAAPADISAKSP